MEKSQDSPSLLSRPTELVARYFDGRATQAATAPELGGLTQALRAHGGAQRTHLDFGCGATPLSLPGDARLICADVSSAMLTAARDALGAPNAEFHRTDGHSPLALRSRSVDLITARRVLEHLRDPAATLRELARVCRPGGLIVLIDLPLRGCQQPRATEGQIAQALPALRTLVPGASDAALLDAFLPNGLWFGARHFGLLPGDIDRWLPGFRRGYCDAPAQIRRRRRWSLRPSKALESEHFSGIWQAPG